MLLKHHYFKIIHTQYKSILIILIKSELFFTNPTSKIVKFSIDNKNFELKPNYSLLVEIRNSIVSIKSNCLFLRPTIFSYKDKYLDVHHS